MIRSAIADGTLIAQLVVQVSRHARLPPPVDRRPASMAETAEPARWDLLLARNASAPDGIRCFGFGFGEEFLIVDRRTGQPRHAKPLSGGEPFSPALALWSRSATVPVANSM